MMLSPSRKDTLGLGLSTLLDGEMPSQEQQDLEASLQGDPQARALQDHLELGSARGREMFDDLLKEPVPLDLVRLIKAAPQPRKAVRLPSEQRSPFPLKLTAMRTAAACLVLLVLGGGLGYMLGLQPAAPARPQIAEANDDWLDDIVAHYRTFSRPGARLVELPASEPAAIIEWLLASTGVNFRIPDLSGNGLTFQGARLFVAGHQPVGQLVYTSTEGEIVSLLFRKNQPDDDGFSELIRDSIALMSWKSPTATYVVVGPSSAASLDEIAAKAAGLI